MSIANSSKFLVTYATWTGATKDVANKIADTIRMQSIDVEVLPVNQVCSVTNYDCLVMGTSIHASKVVKSFAQFLKNHKNDVQKIPHAFFVVCANMNEDTEANREETSAWLMKSLDRIGKFDPISVGLFAGAVLTESSEYKNQNIFIKKVIQSMQAKFLENFGRTDFRDWDAIVQWTKNLVANYFPKA